MSGAIYQATINSAFAQVSDILGFPYIVYRTSGASNPTDPLFAVLNVSILLKTKSGNFNQTPTPGKIIEWQGFCDQTSIMAGDYLAAPGATPLLVGHSAPLAPAQLFECPRTISIYSSQNQSGGGLQLDGSGKPIYGGTTAINEVPLLTGFPAAMASGGRGGQASAGLPEDVYLVGHTIYVSAGSGVVLTSTNYVVDDQGHRYSISAAVQISDGPAPGYWAISAMQDLA